MYSQNGLLSSFSKKLHNIDKDLNCKWEQATGKFVIRQHTGNPILPNPIICVVQDESKEFRYPDLRDIEFLQEADIRREGPKARMKRVAQYMIDEREKDRKRAKAMIRERTVDDKIQLTSMFGKLAGSGKGNSAFRRIKAKAKGEAY